MQSWKASDRRALKILTALEIPKDSSSKSDVEVISATEASSHGLMGSEITSTKPTMAAERFPLSAQVMIKSGEKTLHGYVVNLSSSGAFLHVRDLSLAANGKVQLVIKPNGFGRYYEVQAEIIRSNENMKFATGYGVRFCW